MTEKLYETDSYIKEFDAKVVDCLPFGEKFKVVLDRTAFFPEGGGQKGDVGYIDDVFVCDTQIEQGIIYHTTKQKVEINKILNCQIDFETRFKRMQNHTGEHIVSGIIHSLFGLSNVGFHMGENFVTLDVDGKLTIDDLKKVELRANQAIYQNKNVFVSFPNSEELKQLDYRSKLELKENVRIVTIDGIDCCACCAPHVSKTGEIGLVKILNFYPNKGGTRIELKCGSDAFADYCDKNLANDRIMKLLSAKQDGTTESVQKLLTENNELKLKIKELRGLVALKSLRKMKVENAFVAFCDFRDANYDDLRFCQNRCDFEGEKYQIFLSPSDEGFLYIITGSCDIKDFVCEVNKRLNGKGGGKNGYAQGKVGADEKDIILALYEILKNK